MEALASLPSAFKEAKDEERFEFSKVSFRKCALESGELDAHIDSIRREAPIDWRRRDRLFKLHFINWFDGTLTGDETRKANIRAGAIRWIDEAANLSRPLSDLLDFIELEYSDHISLRRLLAEKKLVEYEFTTWSHLRELLAERRRRYQMLGLQ